MPPNRTISPRELRIAAEHADGLREEKDLTLVYRATPSGKPGDTRRGLVIRQGPAQEGDEVLDVAVVREAEDETDAMTRPAEVMIRYRDSIKSLRELDIDALFWTEPAIDKFVLPYYVNVLNTTEFEALRALKRNPRVMALAHYRPTVYKDNPGGSLLGAAGTADGLLLGMLRLPADGLSDQPEFVTFAEYLSEKNAPPA